MVYNNMSSCIETQKASALKCCNKQMAFCFTSKNALLEMHLFSASLATCTIIFVKVQCSVNKLEENKSSFYWMDDNKKICRTFEFQGNVIVPVFVNK